MREWQADDLNKVIDKKMSYENKLLLRNKMKRLFRRRPRNKDEQNVLDLLCKLKWQKDLAAGKVRIINKREWYVEYD